MSVSLRAASTPVAAAAAAPATATPTLPSGTATGDRVYVMAVTEPPGTGNAPTLSANGSGWTLLSSSAPGNTVQISCWWRIKDAGWTTMPTVQIAAGTSTTNALIAGAVSFSCTGTWQTPSAADFATGADSTSDTSFSATGSNVISATTGEYLMAFAGTSGNTTSTAQAMTATGATLSAVAELADLGTPNGGAVGFKIFGASVSSGTATSAPTVSSTLSGSNTASVYFIRVRDTTAVAGGGSTQPVIRSFSQGAEASGSNTQNITKPSGLVAGDFLMAFVSTDADNTLAGLGSPFPVLGSSEGDSASNYPPIEVSGRVATASDASAASFTFTSTYATGEATVILIAIQTGTFDTTVPVTFGSWTVQARTSTTTQTAAALTGVANALLLAVFGSDTNGVAQAYPSSGPSGMTLVASQSGVANYAIMGLYSQVLSAGGTTGAKSVSPTPTSTVNGWAAAQLMVNPGASAVTALRGAFFPFISS